MISSSHFYLNTEVKIQLDYFKVGIGVISMAEAMKGENFRDSEWNGEQNNWRTLEPILEMKKKISLQGRLFEG